MIRNTLGHSQYDRKNLLAVQKARFTLEDQNLILEVERNILHFLIEDY